MRTVCILSLMLVGLELATGTLEIAAFNIQRLGKTKMSNSTLVNIILNIIGRYDVLLVQELIDNDPALPVTNMLMASVNATYPTTYSYRVSETLGKTCYQERYLFIYRTAKVSVVQDFQYDHGNNRSAFSRPPYVVMFSAGVKQFVLIPQHACPTNAVREIDALFDVVTNMSTMWGTSNILLLGDFNAGCTYVPDKAWATIRLRTNTTFTWLIPDSADTTVSDTVCPYDRIVATATMMTYASPHSAQVFNFRAAYSLDQSLAKAVSDHFPVQVTLNI
ncbi:deoxyribonuclease-1 [Scleropages formosus]|uniref:deoxyribonuclease-1 n=1 Tax=Scleropages formosus TaxID=113540 RepID=UPI0010FA6AE8|nr:deoxyribonuclease-1-like [Scleropages formosus]